MCGYRFASAHGVNPFVGLALDAHPAGVNPQCIGEPQLYRVAMRANLRPLEDDDNVHVLDGESSSADEASDFMQQLDARCVLPPRIGIRIMLPDIAGARRAQNGIRDRVTHNVSVRMSERAALGGDIDAAEYQPPAFDQAVQIVANTDP